MKYIGKLDCYGGIEIQYDGWKLHEYKQSTYWICLLGIKRTYLICIPFLLNYRYRDMAHNNGGARFAYILQSTII